MPESYLAAAVILLGAYFVRGITGFGSGLLAIPLLAHLYPLSFVVPMVLVTDFLASVVLSGKTSPSVCWGEIRGLIPPSMVGMLVGASLLITLPREPLLLGLGTFVLLFGLKYLLNVHGNRKISQFWALPAGLAGGVIGSMFGTGGPPYVIYLTHRLHDKTQLRGTLSGLFMIEGGLRVITFLIMGLFVQADMLAAILMAIPLMVLGLYLGNHVHTGMSHRQQLALIGLLLILSGVSLIWKVI